jgi:tRNA threonylcarbamoyladenosine biosynthesis protein TsaB
MNLLAIETATESCSVALLCGDELVVSSEYAPRRHAELLLPMCDSVLAEAGVQRRQLDAIAVGRGPGAFTGVRLAISAAQGIALALDCPVIPVSSLAALAMDAPDNGSPILAVIDARMGEVYSATYRRRSNGLVELVGVESVGHPDELNVSVDEALNVIGSGWEAYHESIRARLPSAPISTYGKRYPQAAAIAKLAAPLFKSSAAVSPEFALPVYLRDKVALTIEERQAANSIR